MSYCSPTVASEQCKAPWNYGFALGFVLITVLPHVWYIYPIVLDTWHNSHSFSLSASSLSIPKVRQVPYPSTSSNTYWEIWVFELSLQMAESKSSRESCRELVSGSKSLCLADLGMLRECDFNQRIIGVVIKWVGACKLDLVCFS